MISRKSSLTMNIHKTILYQDIQTPPSYHCKSFQQTLQDRPTPNYEYSLLYIKNILSENIPAKLSRFYHFLMLNNLETNMESDCLTTLCLKILSFLNTFMNIKDKIFSKRYVNVYKSIEYFRLKKKGI